MTIRIKKKVETSSKQFANIIARKPLICQSERCIERKNVALKVCIDPNFAMHGSVTPPPYNVCNECYREISKKYQMYCHNIVQPAEEISLYCENRVIN